MSRIGKMPITVPKDVTVTVSGTLVTAKGPKGELKQTINSRMKLEQKDGVLTVARPSDAKEDKAMHGLTRSLVFNMVEGVSNGFAKELEIIGVGYRAQLQGKKIVLNLGFSHPVEVEPPAGIEFELPNQNSIIVRGIDKQAVGAVAADIRKWRLPEPYKGKGIRYKDEYVRRKEGKTGK